LRIYGYDIALQIFEDLKDFLFHDCTLNVISFLILVFLLVLWFLEHRLDISYDLLNGVGWRHLGLAYSLAEIGCNLLMTLDNNVLELVEKLPID
jgi:hypothetical protein